MNRLLIALLLLSSPIIIHAQQQTDTVQIAFLADVHLQDLYGTLQDNSYKGIWNPTTGKYTLLRTMESQLHSTRIFNENYFAFLAAIEDIAKRGIHYVALPGDYSDDGQPLHIRGLQQLLQHYSETYNIQFFITTGNHDPVGPFAQESGKGDFLGEGGKRQPILSTNENYKPNSATLPAIITRDIAKMGYSGITDHLQEFGFFPKESYRYWSTPFSTYSTGNYSYAKAQMAAALSNRTYEVAPGYTVPDVSYLVEPTPGLWLLAIDGNVYIPKDTKASDPKNSKSYSEAGIGYNQVLSHKKHLVDWVHKIAMEAEQQGKTLIAFSHYPMVEFNDGASEAISALMGPDKWQLNRVPSEEVAQTFADAGLKIHFGGHMHLNDTGIRKTKKGNTLVNIQTPSLAAYIPAYKVLTVQPDGILEVNTISIDTVPRFDELFALYRMEYAFLKSQNHPELWDPTILEAKNYHAFTDWHLKELVRLRFLPDDWPKAFKEFMLQVSGADLLALTRMSSDDYATTLLHKKGNLKKWKKGLQKTQKELGQNKLVLSDFEQWNGLDLITDFYRIRSADQLALSDIGPERIRQYQYLAASFFKYQQKGDPIQDKLGLFLTILNRFLSGAPSSHFKVDLKSGAVQDLRPQ